MCHELTSNPTEYAISLAFGTILVLILCGFGMIIAWWLPVVVIGVIVGLGAIVYGLYVGYVALLEYAQRWCE